MAGGGKAHRQATPSQITELRVRLSSLEGTNESVRRYKWLTDDRVLHRFITARNGNVDVALKMLLQHLVSCLFLFLVEKRYTRYVDTRFVRTRYI